MGNLGTVIFLLPFLSARTAASDHYTANSGVTAYVGAGITPGLTLLASGGNLNN